MLAAPRCAGSGDAATRATCRALRAPGKGTGAARRVRGSARRGGARSGRDRA